MTAQIETAIEEQNPSRWQKLLAWLAAFEQAMDYDPHAHTAATIKQLREAVARLEAKVIELEGRDEHKLAPVIADGVDGT